MTTPESESDLMNVEETARFLNLAVKTVRKLTSERRIPAVKISSRCVRYSRCALREWIEQRTIKPRG